MFGSDHPTFTSVTDTTITGTDAEIYIEPYAYELRNPKTSHALLVYNPLCLPAPLPDPINEYHITPLYKYAATPPSPAVGVFQFTGTNNPVPNILDPTPKVGAI